MKVIIVGGGIGGLATAAAFHRRGWQVEVLERAAEFTEVGAGLTIQPNGLRALDAVGLGERLRAGGLADPPAGIRSRRGDWLVRNDVEDLKRRFGSWVTVHRAALVDLLRAAVPPEALRPGIDVQHVQPDGTVHHGGYVMANGPADSHVGLDELRERFARWHQPIPALLGSAHEEAVLQHDTHELPMLPTYVSGNVAVLGDAAHAMTPNLGQGACQALEDAVTLAHAVDTLGVCAGLEAYDRDRRPRTQLIVRRSRQAGAAAHWCCGCRNASTPGSSTRPPICSPPTSLTIRLAPPGSKRARRPGSRSLPSSRPCALSPTTS